MNWIRINKLKYEIIQIRNAIFLSKEIDKTKLKTFIVAHIQQGYTYLKSSRNSNIYALSKDAATISNLILFDFVETTYEFEEDEVVFDIPHIDTQETHFSIGQETTNPVFLSITTFAEEAEEPAAEVNTTIGDVTVDATTDPNNVSVSFQYNNEQADQPLTQFTIPIPSPASAIRSVDLFMTGTNEVGIRVEYENDLGDVVTVEDITPIVLPPSVAPSYETVSKNLQTFDATFTYNVDGDVSTIVYTDGVDTITKTFNYVGGDVSTIVLSGDTPSGITLTKIFTYNVDGDVINISYS